jgi:hypothetical protein
MVSEIVPGAPMILTLGGNYAQPGISAASIPEGQSILRALAWTGERNCGAPIQDSDLHREIGEFRKHYGETLTPATSGPASTADELFLKRLQELSQDYLALQLRQHAKVEGAWVRLFAALARIS